MKVMPHRQYKVMIDGIRRITLGNRKFFKKIYPVVFPIVVWPTWTAPACQASASKFSERPPLIA